MHYSCSLQLFDIIVIIIIAPRALLCLGCSVGRAQSSLLGVVMNSCDRRREVHWPTPIAGLDFLFLCMQIWSKIQHKNCSPLGGILLPFSPAYAHKWRGWGEGGNCPSLTGGSRGGAPPSRDYDSFFSVLVNMYMKLWSNLQ